MSGIVLATAKSLLLCCVVVYVTEGVEATFSAQLYKMVQGKSRHLERVPKWNTDQKTALRIKRALEEDTISSYQSDYDDFLKKCPNYDYDIEELYRESFKGPGKIPSSILVEQKLHNLLLVAAE